MHLPAQSVEAGTAVSTGPVGAGTQLDYPTPCSGPAARLASASGPSARLAYLDGPLGSAGTGTLLD